MNKVYLHIGFGRCSTTTLQTKIFYKLAEKKKVNYMYGKSLLSQMTKLTTNYAKDENYKIYSKKINTLLKEDNKDILLSDESLISSARAWCPSGYQDSLEKNLKYFGSNTKIIITIRKPSDWLLSIFSKLSDGLSFENFFLDKEKYYQANQIKKFLITDLDYEKIINSYREKFTNVYVIKYEEISKFNFLKEFFDLNLDDLEELKNIYSKTFIRKGYTNYYSYKTNLLANKLDRYLRFSKILNHEKIINILEKFYPKKKLQLDFSKINFDIKKLDDKYDKIKTL